VAWEDHATGCGAHNAGARTGCRVCLDRPCRVLYFWAQTHLQIGQAGKSARWPGLGVRATTGLRPGQLGMVFSEPRFLVFFLLVFGVHWLLCANDHRKFLLLAASLFFYGSWDVRFLALIPRLRDRRLLRGAADRARSRAW
jgi:hypothetical protein